MQHECFFVLVAIVLVSVSNTHQTEKCERKRWFNGRWMIRCENIETMEDGNNALRFIRNNGDVHHIYLDNGDTDGLPPDIFASTNITDLYVDHFRMKHLPYDFIEPVCASLNHFRIVNSVIKSGIIPAGKFRKCDQLEHLVIYNSSIRTISANAFQGLVKLRLLHLDRNEIASLDKGTFKDLKKLTRLYIQRNKLQSLEEGIFDPFGKTIQEAYMHENPFHCDCSLQWLKEWIISQKSRNPSFTTGHYEVICNKPKHGDITTLHFCDKLQPLQLIMVKPEDAIGQFSNLLTILLEEAACYSLRANSEKDMLFKLYSALAVKRSIMLFESKIGKMQISTQLTTTGECKLVIPELTELLTILLEEAASYPLQEYSDEDIVKKLNSVLEVKRSIILLELKC